MEQTEAVAPIMEGGWVVGADGAPGPGPRGRADADPRALRGGGRRRREPVRQARRRPARRSRPLGIAARRYYRTSYHPGPWFESWLDLWEGDLLLPGYGWLFPVAGGQINLGAGLLNTFKDFKQVSAQRLFDAFSTMLPPEWEINEDTAEGRVLSGPLPMSLNRVPQAVPGMLLIGDAAGAVNPFNGEGIAYAIETAEIASELIDEALVKDRPGIAMMYPTVLRERYGDYFTIGRGFAKLIGQPDDHEPGHAPPVAEPAGDGVRDAADGQPHRRQGRGPAGPPLRLHRTDRSRVMTRRMLAVLIDYLPIVVMAALAVAFGVVSIDRVVAGSGPTARTR